MELDKPSNDLCGVLSFSFLMCVMVLCIHILQHDVIGIVITHIGMLTLTLIPVHTFQTSF